MADEQEPWKRLGELLIAARVRLGQRNRSAFAKSLGLTHDRTLSDIEHGRRTNYDPATIAFIEQSYGWLTGSVRRVLDGQDPLLAPQMLSGEGTLSAGPVVPDPQDASYVADDTGLPAVALISDEELANRIRVGLEAMDEMRRRSEQGGGPLAGPS